MEFIPTSEITGPVISQLGAVVGRKHIVWSDSLKTALVVLAGVCGGVLVANTAIAAAPRPYDWSGFYVGVNLGGSFGRSDTNYTIAGVPFGSTSQRLDGILGGGQGGYNWQTGPWLLGWETDIQGTSQHGSSSLIDFIPGTPGTPDIPATPGTPGTPGTPAIPCVYEDGPTTPCLPGTGIAATPGTPGTPGTPAIPGIPGKPAVTGLITYKNSLPWFGTFRGRIGVMPAQFGVMPAQHWLVYATGGLAYGEVTTNETLTVGGMSVGLSSSPTKLGWTVGGGVEAALWNNWTAKFEYLYIDFGTINDTLIGIAPIMPIVTSSHVTDNIVRLGINWRFGGP